MPPAGFNRQWISATVASAAIVTLCYLVASGRLRRAVEILTPRSTNRSTTDSKDRRKISESHECYHATVAAVQKPASDDNVPPITSVTIVYATVKGTSEALARRAAESLEQAKLSGEGEDGFLKARTIDALDFSLVDYAKNPPAGDVLVFLISCYGEGDPPDTAYRMFREIKKMEKRSLENRLIRTAVFGLGHSAFEKFNGAGRRLVKLLSRVGAQFICSYGEADGAEDTDADFDFWFENELVPALSGRGPVSVGSVPASSGTVPVNGESPGRVEESQGTAASVSDMRDKTLKKKNSGRVRSASRRRGSRQEPLVSQFPDVNTGEVWSVVCNDRIQRIVSSVRVMSSDVGFDSRVMQEMNSRVEFDGAASRALFELGLLKVESRVEHYDAPFPGRKQMARLIMGPAEVDAALEPNHRAFCPPVDHSKLVTAGPGPINFRSCNGGSSSDAEEVAGPVGSPSPQSAIFSSPVEQRECFEYEIGDVLDVLPYQDRQLVESLFERLLLNPRTGKRCAGMENLKITDRVIFESSAGPLPFPSGSTFETILASFIDVTSTPKKDVLLKLLRFVPDGEDRAIVERALATWPRVDARLFESSSLGEEFLSLGETLLIFFDSAIFGGSLLDLMATLLVLPRQHLRSFSIDTSPDEFPLARNLGISVSLDTKNRRRLAADLIEKVRQKNAGPLAAALLRGPIVTGLTSGLINGPQGVCHLMGKITPAPHLYFDLREPVLFIAVGSGIAPVRAMLWQIARQSSDELTDEMREALEGAEKEGGRKLDKFERRKLFNLPETVGLIYGCPDDAHFPFRSEVERWSRASAVERFEKPPIISHSILAFSQAQSYKVYVQDVLFLERRLVNSVANSEKGRILICGSLKMAQAVRGALSGLLGEERRAELKREGRLVEEAWE